MPLKKGTKIGANSGHLMTEGEIAKALGLTRHEVNYITRTAMAKLRKNPTAKKYIGYFND